MTHCCTNGINRCKSHHDLVGENEKGSWFSAMHFIHSAIYYLQGRRSLNPTGPKGPVGHCWVCWELMDHLNWNQKELNILRKRKRVVVFCFVLHTICHILLKGLRNLTPHWTYGALGPPKFGPNK